MTDIQTHGPGEGRPKNSTQTISLIVGGILFILGLCGILFEGFAGLHLSTLYSTIIAISGGMLFYAGWRNNSQYAFLCCLGFTVFFGLHAFAGWVFGEPGVPQVGFDKPDPNWLRIIPGLHELGRSDHILNTVLTVVLAGGAVDWFRRNSEKGHRTDTFRDIKTNLKNQRTNRPLPH